MPFIANGLKRMIDNTPRRLFLILVPLGIITFTIDVTSDVAWMRWSALIWVVAVPFWLFLHWQDRRANKDTEPSKP